MTKRGQKKWGRNSVLIVKEFENLKDAIEYMFNVVQDSYFLERIDHISLFVRESKFRVVVDFWATNDRVIEEFLNVFGSAKVVSI